MNKLKKKNYMITSTNAKNKRAFDKIQYPFAIKILSKPGIANNFLNLIKTSTTNLQLISYLIVRN